MFRKFRLKSLTVPAIKGGASNRSAMNLLDGLFDAYPKASSTKMIAGLLYAYSLLKIGAYKPSSVTRGSPTQAKVGFS